MKPASSERTPTPSAISGLVLSATRRHVLVSLDGVHLQNATVAVRDLALVAGDRVTLRYEGDEYLVTTLEERRNTLARSYRHEMKTVAANIDHLFIVAAIPPLLNTLSIDRIAVVAHAQGIPLSLLVNKIDLGVDICAETIRTYEQLGMPVLQTAAKFGAGIDTLRSMLDQLDGSVIALCGISGVGKSTILNALIPEAARSTGEVSIRTGQGRQTTTQATGFLYPRSAPKQGLAIIDLPGIQQFGVAHLTLSQVAEAFGEIQHHATACAFSNCSHLREEHCGVRAAVEAGAIAQSRFDSYVHMCQEIVAAKPY